ncbi:hypothetical protein [Micromonospora sp. L32]|uniref:hypothetical protein n=1 Tax=Micromonospora sp. L32 TaxID=3452214 RepID=UPI003F89DA99
MLDAKGRVFFLSENSAGRRVRWSRRLMPLILRRGVGVRVNVHSQVQLNVHSVVQMAAHVRAFDRPRASQRIQRDPQERAGGIVTSRYQRVGIDRMAHPLLPN